MFKSPNSSANKHELDDFSSSESRCQIRQGHYIRTGSAVLRRDSDTKLEITYNLHSDTLLIMAEISTCLPLKRESVIAAHELVKPLIHETPVLTNTFLNDLASKPRDHESLRENEKGRTPAKPTIRLWFKCENFQRAGAFKARGAFHAIERLKLEPGWLENGGREKGVATHSSGEPSLSPFLRYSVHMNDSDPRSRIGR